MKFALRLVLGLAVGAPAIAMATPARSVVVAQEGLGKKPKKPKKHKQILVPQPNPCDGK